MKALISIFQNFIKVKDTTHDHLKIQREMIIDAAIKVLTFFYQKGDTFSIEKHQIGVLIAISRRVKDKLKAIVLEGLKNNFFRVKGSVAQIYLNAFFETFPDEGPQYLHTWIHQKIIERREKPESVGNI